MQLEFKIRDIKIVKIFVIFGRGNEKEIIFDFSIATELNLPTKKYSIQKTTLKGANVV